MAFTISLQSTSAAVAGRSFRFLANLTSGTTWNNTNSSLVYPLSITGINGIIIQNQTTSGGNLCDCTVFPGNGSGTLIITDTVNNTTQTIIVNSTQFPHIKSGNNWYVDGTSLYLPKAPNTIFNPGALIFPQGSGQIGYQVIAHNNLGTTPGAVPNLIVQGNYPINDSYFNGDTTSWIFHPRITYINCAPNDLSVSGYITVSWDNISQATSYDLVRTRDGINWQLIGNTTSNTLNDMVSFGTSFTPYSLPTSDTTSSNSDSNLGTSWNTAFATLNKAISVANSGDTIYIRGNIYDLNNIVIPNGVNIIGNDVGNTNLISLFPNSTSAHSCYRLPSSADLTDITFYTDSFNQPVIGCGTSDISMVDCNLYRIKVLGNTNALRLATPNCGVTVTDFLFSSSHGTCGLVATSSGTILNLTRGTCFARGGIVEPKNHAISLQLNGGYICSRDVTFSSGIDSMQLTTSNSNCILATTTTTLRGGIFINSNSFGGGQNGYDWLVASGNLTGIWLMNTSIDLVKNPTMSSGINLVQSYQHSYLPDPLLAQGNYIYVHQ